VNLVSEKILPHNIDAEQSVLGSLLLDNETVPQVARIISPDDFYLEAHRQIYMAVLELEEAGQPVDFVTLTNKLRDKGELEKIGGATYVASLANIVPTPTNVEYYARIVNEKALLRNLVHAATRIAALGYAGSDNMERVISEAESTLLEVAASSTSPAFSSVKEILNAVFKDIEERYRHKGLINGVATGLTDLDKLCCGLQSGDLIIIAGRPAMGKTSLGLTIAHNVALRQRLPVAVFSLEMSREQLVQRILCTEAMVDLQKVRSGNLTEEDWVRLNTAAVQLSTAPLYIHDAFGITTRQLRAEARRLQLEKGLGLIVIDYIQLMQANRRSENRQQEIADISRSLKGLAKDLNVPVLALAQLSRQVEQRVSKRPIMSDLRESGSLEQDSDLVMFIYREEYYKPDTEKKGIAELIVAKQRNGPTGTIEMAFLKEFTRFVNLARENED
jgi:replicative DNA helicase